MDRITKGVRRATKSSYEITFTYNGETCRERVKLKPNAGNDLKAKRFKHAIDQAIIDGVFDYSVTFPNSKKGKAIKAERNIYKLDNYMLDWFDKNQHRYKASVKKQINNMINNIFIPAIGGLYLSDLKRYHIRNMADSWDVTNKTIRTRLSRIRVILDAALDDELIEANPLYGWNYKPPVEKVTKDDVNPFTKDELQKFLDGLQIKEELYLFQTMLFTGMRPSEIVCLEWSDINFSAGYIDVTKAKTDESKLVEVPKTSKSRRRIKILKPCYEALKAQQQITGLAGGLVFKNPRTDRAWLIGRIYKIWVKHLKRLELEHRRMYQTRHTYASMMLSAGESVMWVAEQLGHSDWVMVARIYGKWIPDADLDAGSKGVGVFWNK